MKTEGLFIKPFMKPIVYCFLAEFCLFINQNVFSVKNILYS